MGRCIPIESGSRPKMNTFAPKITSKSQQEVLVMTIQDRLNGFRQKIENGFELVTEEVNELSERLDVLEDTILELHTRVRYLENVVATSAETHQPSPSLNMPHGELILDQTDAFFFRYTHITDQF